MEARLHLSHRSVLAHDDSYRDVRLSKGVLHEADETLFRDQRPRRDECDAVGLQSRELLAQLGDGAGAPVNGSRIGVREEPFHGVVILRTA